MLSSDQDWLDNLNSERRAAGLDRISYETFEIVMDRLEKEWFHLVSRRIRKLLEIPEGTKFITDKGHTEARHGHAVRRFYVRHL